MAENSASFRREDIDMNDFKVGYAAVNINPPLGIGVCGYYVQRFAKGFLDDLESSALAVSCGEKLLVLISVDNCQIDTEIINRYRTDIEQATGILKEHIIITATHTHTGPLASPPTAFEADEQLSIVMRNFWEKDWWMR